MAPTRGSDRGRLTGHMPLQKVASTMGYLYHKTALDKYCRHDKIARYAMHRGHCTVDLYNRNRCGCGYTARRVADDVPLPKAAGNKATVPHVYTEVLAKVLVSHSGLHYINKSFRQPPEGRECTMFLCLSDEQRIFLTF